MAPCMSCHRTFSFNPNHVPSVRRIDGVREPVCRACMVSANEIRVTRGLEPHPIRSDAYDPLPEEELG